MAGEGPYLQDVVSRVVAIVADADLCAHVPAAEGAGGELQAANLQQHVGHCGEAVPLQAQVLEPLKPAETTQPSSPRGGGPSGSHVGGTASVWGCGNASGLPELAVLELVSWTLPYTWGTTGSTAGSEDIHFEHVSLVIRVNI